MSIALSSLIEATKEDEGLLRQILSSLSCNKDEDIENFYIVEQLSLRVCQKQEPI